MENDGDLGIRDQRPLVTGDDDMRPDAERGQICLSWMPPPRVVGAKCSLATRSPQSLMGAHMGRSVGLSTCRVPSDEVLAGATRGTSILGRHVSLVFGMEEAGYTHKQRHESIFLQSLACHPLFLCISRLTVFVGA